MADSAETGEHLVSFFLYSLFIYPITNYIVSPQRKYPRWKAALYAILFLGAVATIHLKYENAEKGPNYFELLQVRRDTPVSFIKKAYRTISLELHPDKNKSPTAADDFRKVQHAFDVITDKSKRRDYELLGDHGVKLSSQIVIDQKYLLLHLIIYYTSSLIFAFLMTFSESTGDAFHYSIFGLASMFLVELLLILKEVELPARYFPYVTAHEFISTLHRLFPAFMNGCRCLTGAFYQDRKLEREKLLEELTNQTKEMSSQISRISHSMEELVDQVIEKRNDQSIRSESEDSSISLFEKIIKKASMALMASKDGREGILKKQLENSLQLIENPSKLAKSMAINLNSSSSWLTIRNLLIFLAVRFLFFKSSK